ncbi:MAG: NusG domain II-containing protein [Gammaproteobacteria bacterium]|nr:NusG domain II-containing protein [Gammaproteobacteria bacterium]MDH5802107.1 NusG domain II-containing protein [Gammaproteobacteria bacterium]
MLSSEEQVTRGDAVVILVAAVWLAFIYFMAVKPTQTGSQATVLLSGKPWKTFDLNRDQLIEVPGSVGTSSLRIKDGQIRFIDSPCTAKQCILQGWLKYSGELAVCLPNRVSVQILGANPRYDSINF